MLQSIHTRFIGIHTRLIGILRVCAPTHTLAQQPKTQTREQQNAPTREQQNAPTKQTREQQNAPTQERQSARTKEPSVLDQALGIASTLTDDDDDEPPPAPNPPAGIPDEAELPFASDEEVPRCCCQHAHCLSSALLI